METRVVELPELKLAGVPLLFDLQNPSFGKAWELFMEEQEQVHWKNQNGYGVEIYGNEMKRSGKLFYFASMEVENLDNLPNGFFMRVLPKSKYIVAKCEATSEAIGTTFRKLYSEVIPNSEYESLNYYDFEFYGDDFKGMDQENSFVEVYIPIVNKGE